MTTERDQRPVQGSDGGGDSYRFLCGADMDPTAVLAAYPGARFVARARIVAADVTADEVWGIVVRTPSAPAETATEVEIITDDGRRFRAWLVADGRPRGAPAAILAAAQYWELPPAYVARLRAAAAPPAENDEK